MSTKLTTGSIIVLLCASYLGFKHQGCTCCCCKHDVNKIINNGEKRYSFILGSKVDIMERSDFFSDGWLNFKCVYKKKQLDIYELKYEEFKEPSQQEFNFDVQKRIYVYSYKNEQYVLLKSNKHEYVLLDHGNKTWVIVEIKQSSEGQGNTFYISDISSEKYNMDSSESVGAFHDVDFNSIKFVAANTKNVKNLGSLFWNTQAKTDQYSYQIINPGILCVENCMSFEKIFCFNSEGLPDIDKNEIEKCWKIHKKADILWFYYDKKYALSPKGKDFKELSEGN
jgi:hypothetical protein